MTLCYNEKTALYIAVEKENVELVRILLSCPNIDVNSRSIEKKINQFKNMALVLKNATKKNNMIVIVE